MAIIPLKQQVTVRRYGDVDEWGVSADFIENVLKARVDEQVTLVKNQQGEEVASSATIYLDKIADVQYSDVIIFKNELGFVLEESPKSITPKRSISGKTLVTVVSV